jgi:hypothetical protein
MRHFKTLIFDVVKRDVIHAVLNLINQVHMKCTSRTCVLRCLSICNWSFEQLSPSQAYAQQEREQTQIDQGIIKHCVELFEVMGMGSLDTYKVCRLLCFLFFRNGVEICAIGFCVQRI